MRVANPWAVIGRFSDSGRLTLPEASLNVPIEDLLSSFVSTLDW